MNENQERANVFEQKLTIVIAAPRPFKDGEVFVRDGNSSEIDRLAVPTHSANLTLAVKPFWMTIGKGVYVTLVGHLSGDGASVNAADSYVVVEEPSREIPFRFRR